MDSCSMFRAFALRKKFSQGTLLRLTDYFILPGTTLHLPGYTPLSVSFYSPPFLKNLTVNPARLHEGDFARLDRLPCSSCSPRCWYASDGLGGCGGGFARMGIILHCRISSHLLRTREQYHLPSFWLIKLNLMWVSCKGIKNLAPLLCFFCLLGI